MTTATTFSIQIDRFVKKAKGAVAEFHTEFAQDVIEEVVRTTPVKTGFLRGSWWASLGAPTVSAGAPDPSGAGAVARLNLVASTYGPGETLYVMNGAKYARFVHDGTSRMAARPWVTRVVARAPLIAEAAARRVAVA